MEIEKNVPIPPKKSNKPHLILAHRMKIGDSILFANQKEADTVKNSLIHANKKTCQRAVEGGIRVWRTE
jgi:hypothetical protein